MSEGTRRRRPSRGCRMNLEKAREMRRRRAAGEKLVSLAFAFHCTESLVSKICRGKIWPEPEGA